MAQLPMGTLFPEISFGSRAISSSREFNDHQATGLGELLYPLSNSSNAGIKQRLSGVSLFLGKEKVVSNGEGQVHNELDGHVQLGLVKGDELVKGERYD